MIMDLVGDIARQTGGKIELYIDTLGVTGDVEEVRHNCYLRVPATGYNHLLFRVTTPLPGPWPAEITTPEGDPPARASNETELRVAVEAVLQRDRTREIVHFLLSISS